MGALNTKAALLWMVLICFCNFNSITMVDARDLVVGGEKWHFGFNYTDWALKSAPFYVNDVLVFKYARPNGSIFHDVWRIHQVQKFKMCNLQGAQRLAHENSGVDEGFRYKLKEKKPYYIACGIRDGFHCNVGLMKFSLQPI
ncbi:hypothetical protein SUGI_1022090 [Cryptomeria japonica]|uniref:uncharacterized protein LOC131035486 n=1 Tax=Cryptomeria japonica TaxID=3369 RepID=UPI002414AA2A|nr:uncharacterized protein LOC131035486 [Cryptomeria japonica]GLJ48422.1 hypothetical protein SUGI_1022090 [Cryptomeria japonica]